MHTEKAILVVCTTQCKVRFSTVRLFVLLFTHIIMTKETYLFGSRILEEYYWLLCKNDENTDEYNLLWEKENHKYIYIHDSDRKEVEDYNLNWDYHDAIQWSSLICHEALTEIGHGQNDHKDSALDENLSVCITESGIQERAKEEHDNVKALLDRSEKALFEGGSNVEAVAEILSINNAKNESYEIEDCSMTDQTKGMNGGKKEKQFKHKLSMTTKRNDRYRSDPNCSEALCNTEEQRQSGSTFDVITGSPFKIRTSKKAFLFLLLILNGLYPTAPAAINHDQKTRGLEEYRLLITSKCYFRDIIRSETCHTNEKSLNSYIDFCGFADLCAIDSEPTCVDGEYGGMLHICSPKNLTCAKGYRRKVWLDNDTDVVYVKEEKCPNGRYQPIESNCYHACSNRHEDLQDLPAQYSLFSKGDNKSPTWIYCNFEKGFYNMDGKFLLAYNDQFQYFPYFCTSVSEAHPCGSGESPLPRVKVMPAHRRTILVKKAYLQTTSAIAALTISAVSDRNTSTTENQSPSTETKEDKEISITLQDVSSAVLIFLAVLVVLICMVLIGVYVLCCKRFKQRRRKTVNITRVRKTENKANFEYVDHVHIYQKTTGSKNDGTSDESIEMEGLL